MSGVFRFFFLHPVISTDSADPSRLISCDLNDISCCPILIITQTPLTLFVYFSSLYLYLSDPELSMGRYHEGK